MCYYPAGLPGTNQLQARVHDQREGPGRYGRLQERRRDQVQRAWSRSGAPVVIHRAIIGSFERFLGILIEHFGGKWPFWISPRQILIVPVMPAVNDYVEELQQILRGDKLNVDIDISGNTMQKKIRTGQLAQYNFIFGKSDREFSSFFWMVLTLRSRRRSRKGVSLCQHP